MEHHLLALFHDLVRLETDLWNRADARLRAEHQLSLAWLEVMTVISETPDCRVIDISNRHSITVGGASKLVDKIEQSGWSRRTRNPSDGRSSLIELTPAGQLMLEAGRQILAHQVDMDLTSAATPAELKVLATTLAKLRAAVPAGDRAPAPPN